MAIPVCPFSPTILFDPFSLNPTRFSYGELRELAKALQLPRYIRTRSRYKFSRIEALALTCARFRTAGDQHELSLLYDRTQSAISEITNWVAMHCDDKWSHLLDFDHTHLLSPHNLERYAEAVYRRGAPLRSIWGFIDCTIRAISRPTEFQRVAYNGHKRKHALKFQAVMLPNGMFGHLFGPVEGRRNDNYLLTASGLLDKCAQYALRDGTDVHTPGMVI